MRGVSEVTWRDRVGKENAPQNMTGAVNLVCMHVHHSASSDSLQPHGLQHTRLLCPWNFPGKNAGAGCHFLLQGIFLTYGSKQRLLHWQVDSLPLCHIGLNKFFIRLWKFLIQKTTSGGKALSYLGQILKISPLFPILQSCIFSKNVSNF